MAASRARRRRSAEQALNKNCQKNPSSFQIDTCVGQDIDCLVVEVGEAGKISFLKFDFRGQDLENNFKIKI